MQTEGKSGTPMEVDQRGLALMLANSRDFLAYESMRTGLVFEWGVATFDPAAADTVLLIRNDKSGYNLHIYDFNLHSDVETEFQIHYVAAASGLTLAGTPVSGQSWNRVLDVQASGYCTAYADETANAQGDIIRRNILYANTEKKYDFRGGLIVKAGDAIAVDYTADTGEAYCNVVGVFLPITQTQRGFTE